MCCCLLGPEKYWLGGAAASWIVRCDALQYKSRFYESRFTRISIFLLAPSPLSPPTTAQPRTKHQPPKSSSGGPQQVEMNSPSALLPITQTIQTGPLTVRIQCEGSLCSFWEFRISQYEPFGMLNCLCAVKVHCDTVRGHTGTVDLHTVHLRRLRHLRRAGTD